MFFLLLDILKNISFPKYYKKNNNELAYKKDIWYSDSIHKKISKITCSPPSGYTELKEGSENSFPTNAKLYACNKNLNHLNADGSIVDLEHCTFTKIKDTGTNGGGAVYIKTTGNSGKNTISVEIKYCLFTENHGSIGGAISIFTQQNARKFYIVNCEFIKNEATSTSGLGGAICAKLTYGFIENCIFNNNKGAKGRDVYYESKTTTTSLKAEQKLTFNNNTFKNDLNAGTNSLIYMAWNDKCSISFQKNQIIIGQSVSANVKLFEYSGTLKQTKISLSNNCIYPSESNIIKAKDLTFFKSGFPTICKVDESTTPIQIPTQTPTTSIQTPTIEPTQTPTIEPTQIITSKPPDTIVCPSKPTKSLLELQENQGLPSGNTKNIYAENKNLKNIKGTNCNIVICHCSFIGIEDRSSNGGGAIYISGSRSNPTGNSTITGCTFKKCKGQKGGAVSISTEQRVRLFAFNYCTFEENEATGTDKYGGAIYFLWAFGSIHKCTFINNKGKNGCDFYYKYKNKDPISANFLEISENTFESNINDNLDKCLIYFDWSSKTSTITFKSNNVKIGSSVSDLYLFGDTTGFVSSYISLSDNCIIPGKSYIVKSNYVAFEQYKNGFLDECSKDQIMPSLTKSPKPTVTATPEATVTATPEATVTATPEATVTATPEATVTATPEATVTATPEATVTATPEATVTATPEATVTATPEATVTATPEATVTATPEATVTATPEATVTATPEATVTATPEATVTATPEATVTATPEATVTATPEATVTATPEATVTATPEATVTATPEATVTATPEATVTATPEATVTATPEATVTATPEATVTATPEATVTATPEATVTATPEATVTATPEATVTATPEATVTATPEATVTATPEATVTATPEATVTATPEATVTATPEATVTATPEATVTATPEATVTATPEATVTATPEATVTATPEATVTATPEATVTATPEATVTATPEATVTATPEATVTATPEATVTATPEATVTATPEATVTATPEATVTATPEATVTATPEATVTATPEATVTATPEPTVTATPEATVTATPEATVTATPEATVTATPEATVTATPEATVTATPEATVTATPEATVTATPEATVTATPEATVTATPEATVTATLESIIEGTLKYTAIAKPEPTLVATMTDVPIPTIKETNEYTKIVSSTKTHPPKPDESQTFIESPKATPTATQHCIQSKTEFSSSESFMKTPDPATYIISTAYEVETSSKNDDEMINQTSSNDTTNAILKSTKSNKTKIVIGICAGLVAFLVLTALTAFLIIHKKSKERIKYQAYDTEQSKLYSIDHEQNSENNPLYNDDINANKDPFMEDFDEL